MKYREMNINNLQIPNMKNVANGWDVKNKKPELGIMKLM